MPVFRETSNAARDLRILPSRAPPLPRLSQLPDFRNGSEENREVVVIGAGPSGLFLTLLLARYGITGSSLLCLDSKAETLKAGQADGLQPRTLEILQSLGIAGEIISEGCHMEEVAFWNPAQSASQRNGDEAHVQKGIERTSFVPDVDVPARFPFEVTIHQGRIERILQENLKLYAPEDTIRRSHRFLEYTVDETQAEFNPGEYLVGADGARSSVRKCMGIELQGETSDHIWGVCDFVADTDFPDIRKRCAVHSDAGSVMVIPREQMATGDYLTRLYVQVPGEASGSVDSATDKKTADKRRRGAVTLEYIFQQARAVFAPYRIDIKQGTAPDWWAAYQIGQRMASEFSARTADGVDRIFIVGDAGQGMNVSMMDSYNLAWKLAHSLHGLTPRTAAPGTADAILETFEQERVDTARQLIEFDTRFSHMFSGQIGPTTGAEAAGLTHEEFLRVFSEGNGFTSGCGLQYKPSRLVRRPVESHADDNLPRRDPLSGILTPGRRLLDVKVRRYADATTRHLHDEMPSTGRYHVLVLADGSGASQAAVLSSIDILQRFPAGVINLIILHPLKDRFEWVDLPPGVKTYAEMRIYGLAKTEDAYDQLGVAKDEGLVAVIRPDGYRDDPFHFIPCTKDSVLPALDDPRPEHTWAKRFDPNPRHWSWGNATEGHEDDFEGPHDRHYPDRPGEPGEHHSPEIPGRLGKPTHPRPPHHGSYRGRGIYLCGYIDVPLDYTNESDTRISRLAVTKYQVSGLAHRGHRRPHDKPRHGAGTKSERTIVIEPGGPGGSGTSMAWRSSEHISKRLSDGKYDVLGWDPRGVNASLPTISCFPYDVDRDHWSIRMSQYRETSPSPRAQLEFFDVMSDSIFHACQKLHGDIPRFVSTAFVARDLEQIRLALGEDGLTGYLVSYGTGIGQTYANMFPNSVGRMILDGTEYVRDHRVLGGFGWTALDNGTDAFHDGFLGECVHAGPEHCALAKPEKGDAVTLDELQERMETLIRSLTRRPLISYTKSSGPSLITYSNLVGLLYGAMYNAKGWPALAQMLYELEAGNTTLAATMLERSVWQYDPTKPPSPTKRPTSEELGALVICADQYDSPEPRDGLDWYESLWANMTTKSWIAGNSRFQNIFPCRHFTKYWPKPAEVFRGDLNKTLSNPVLLIAETYDPATPLRNGRRLLGEMGKNARLIAHHGYGHSSRDTSACTDAIAKAYILDGTLPKDQETACYADEKPYLYGVKKDGVQVQRDPIEIWDEHIRELALLKPPQLLG
ncbi:hypothetical protein ED733_005576 [Metarhizium rileyi]|uniref:Uncharacterized protein n=1 Tax=Metarhizium rileyi (strain RCEF 4871) TaxID=1649241 RepID=A0A5C6GFY1_METRR|nr:hypothetical protein ED733_005576 [Metarhizium rileyi]